jgi:nucleotide-binding universal stress UspA family protein
MIAIRHLLCPVDRSEFSRHALRYAVMLAGWYEADVTAITVRPVALPPSLWLEAPASIPTEQPEEQERVLASVQAFVREAVGSAPVRIEVVEGAIVPRILDAAVSLPADLIVMGTHGASGFERLLLGSVTEKVLRRARCPVLTVPRGVEAPGEPATAPAFKTIVCGTDFSEASNRAFEYALSLAQEAGGRLVLVHVLESLPEEEPRFSSHFNVPEVRRLLEHDARTSLEALVTEQARTWCDVEIVVGHGKAGRELLRIATATHADVIVVGVHGRSAADLALFGSTTQHVLRQAPCPVLSVSPLASAVGADTTHQAQASAVR